MAILQQRETKSDVMIAAVDLFFTKGYHATSIREISAKAGVNVATVSYYFAGKQGLLEECLIGFFEPYLEVLEKVAKSIELTNDPARSFMMEAAFSLIEFQQQNHRFARFAWREVTMDSQMVREMTSCYLRKEQYIWKLLLAQDIEKGISIKISPSFFLIQLTSMISMPFLQSQTIQELWNVNPSEKLFTRLYSNIIKEWYLGVTCESAIVL
ncbi:TetR/AcrR family transcriptional regulator [Jeotgalibacillus sp. S-D1]|uniref:forespore capture DNA-binding protein RefZ n=1 Tax=Jeotgalibacillus sp. S-D1 TaxID=2552189 RepID=UPI00105A272B|nr:forespore capture DNA-binding protein RefZ [Jeotgalibacillus sp. S-D1]TDL34301.1 TetR/AcrR family transcriptional regulator [Jeotgalibacillus sp. S-D1]